MCVLDLLETTVAVLLAVVLAQHLQLVICQPWQEAGSCFGGQREIVRQGHVRDRARRALDQLRFADLSRDRRRVPGARTWQLR